MSDSEFDVILVGAGPGGVTGASVCGSTIPVSCAPRRMTKSAQPPKPTINTMSAINR
jgi:hypothetical protein